MTKLNLGGGHNWEETGWTNLEASRGYDLRERMLCEYPAESVDLIYSSHTLEHMTYVQGRRLLGHCARVLKPDGLIRLVVPDCEKFARNWMAGDDTFLKMATMRDYFATNRDCLIQMGADAGGNEEKSAVEHLFFWDTWLLAWVLASVGFHSAVVRSFRVSGIVEFRTPAALDDGGMPLRGFDNILTEPISCYIEATKMRSWDEWRASAGRLVVD